MMAIGVCVLLLVASSTLVQGIENSSATFEDLLEVWDPYRLIDVWNSTESYGQDVVLGDRCSQEIGQFLGALDDGEIWAVKLVDASGRYRRGFFSGNGFWMGSNAVCKDLNDGVDGILPFDVGFFVAVMELKILVPKLERTNEVTLGLCMPRSCTPGDVKAVIHKATLEDLPRVISIRYVRFLSQVYSYFGDPKFYILSIVSAIVFSLMVAASIYDTKRRRIWNIYKDNCSKENVAFNNNGRGKCEKEKPTNLTVFSVKSNHNSSDVSECNGNKFAFVHQMTPETQELNGDHQKNDLERAKENGKDVSNNVDIPPPESMLLNILLAFSVPANLGKICNLDLGDDTLGPVHGLRCFSLLWVIFVHICLVLFQLSDNKTFRTRAEKDFLYQTVSNGAYSVDTFFFISGLLVSFVYFRTVKKHNLRENPQRPGVLGQITQFFDMIIYRFCRLTPPYLFVIGVVEVSMKWFKDNSVMELPTLDYVTCSKYWWRNMLYINTLYPAKERCMGWSWYLANDTQFYTIGVIILIIAVKYFWAGAATVGVFFISSWCTTAFITIRSEHTPSIQDPFANYEELYDKPWTRIGPYLVGMCIGWLLFVTNCKIRMNKVLVALGWTLAMACTSSIVYGLYYVTLTPATSAAYVALSHTAWALSIAWVLVACCSGYGGFVNTILSWRFLYPFSRLTYCAYLIHPMLMRSMVLNSDSSVHLTRDLVIITFCGFVVAAYGIALIISLAFEAPAVALLRMSHPLKRKRRNNPDS